MLDNVDKIITEYVNNQNYQKNILWLKQIVPMCENVLNMKVPQINTTSYSREFDINESINYVYEFIKSINQEMANNFLNVINFSDGNKKIVNIFPRNDYANLEKYRNEVDFNGNVYVYYENNPSDMFIIFHEMLHKLNQTYFINQNGEFEENDVRDYFGEAVSIIGEMLLGKWLIEKGVIMENDFNLRKIERLRMTKENARDVLIENELIQMKLAGLEINSENLQNVLETTKNQALLQIYNDEARDFRRINSISKHKKLNFKRSQRYVIGVYLTERFLSKYNSIEAFLKLHNEVGNINADMNKVVDDLKEEDIVL